MHIKVNTLASDTSEKQTDQMTNVISRASRDTQNHSVENERAGSWRFEAACFCLDLKGRGLYGRSEAALLALPISTLLLLL